MGVYCLVLYGLVALVLAKNSYLLVLCDGDILKLKDRYNFDVA